MENEFSVGDTVRLLSDGPLMTVNEYDQKNNLVDCIWFNLEENMCAATFKGEVIMLDDDEFDMDDFDDEDEEWEEELVEEDEK